MANNKILVNSLTATNGTHLSKTKNLNYPLVKHFSSTEYTITTPKQLYEIIKKVSKVGDCLIKGNLTRVLTNESRARSTDANLQTQWICFDLDGAAYSDPEEFVKDLPRQFHGVSYTCQYSASQGLKSGLTSSLKLTSTNVALLWPLDITVCQNDKIIYVAPPQDRTDKKQPDPWIYFVQKKNSLRKTGGLSPKRNTALKKVGSIEVMSAPGVCAVTGHREERGFYYLNLNGGDSWAYYHPVGQNEILYNFKGEPFYLIKELLKRSRRQRQTNTIII